MSNGPSVFGMQISHVRAILGYACREVARTGRPLGIRRYRAMDVVIVPLAEWERLKRMEMAMAQAEEDPGEEPGSEGEREVDATRCTRTDRDRSS
jgi:PHD/YefM family antitoxin component YafN of YafNO toxin-antitoxin module